MEIAGCLYVDLKGRSDIDHDASDVERESHLRLPKWDGSTPLGLNRFGWYLLLFATV